MKTCQGRVTGNKQLFLGLIQNNVMNVVPLLTTCLLSIWGQGCGN